MIGWMIRARGGCGAGPSLRLRAILGCILATAPVEAATAQDEPGRTHPPECSVASFGGGLQDAQQTTLFAPFSKQSGIVVRVAGWDGSLAALEKLAETGSNPWDLVLMEMAPLRLACRQGLLWSDPLTADPANPLPDSSGQDCGIDALRMNLVLAWDKSRVDMVPTWSDFWDVARRPGKRGLRRDPRGTLEIALMADGVAPEDIYRTLSSTEGVDRAFRKLDQLKPYIVWWNTPTEAVQIIESGAVLMTSAPYGEVAAADQAGHHSFGAQWLQSVGVNLGWAVPRPTSPEHRLLAQRMAAYLADPTRQAAFSAIYPARNPAPPDTSTVPGGRAAPSASGVTDDHRQATLMMDDGFWVDHLIFLRQRFDAWLGAR